MENKFQIFVVISYNITNLTIESTESVTRSILPRLIDRLESIERLVMTKFLKISSGNFKSPVNVIGSNVQVSFGLSIPVSNPVSSLVLPV